MMVRAKTAYPGFREVLAAMPEPPQSRRSAVHTWLQRNARQVERQVADRAMDWDAFAAALAKLGITNKVGNPFSGSAVKQTWYRVRPVGSKPARGASSRKKAATTETVTPAAADAKPAEVLQSFKPEDSEPGFTTASLKRHKDSTP